MRFWSRLLLFLTEIRTNVATGNTSLRKRLCSLELLFFCSSIFLYIPSCHRCHQMSRSPRRFRGLLRVPLYCFLVMFDLHIVRVRPSRLTLALSRVAFEVAMLGSYFLRIWCGHPTPSCYYRFVLQWHLRGSSLVCTNMTRLFISSLVRVNDRW